MPRGFKKYDFVKVVMLADAKEQARLIEAEGMIADVTESEYPYEVFFFDRNFQRFSLENGIYCWKDYQLEAI
ncbi:hypothetical protein [Paratissierella segnis]|jgi:hypothetical protein|uniref:Uncharacterized protein n=1 Tax=Paratissierella segnis TaxID=2763679 RepID=A0A926EW21_9FIRM|nr:hypothetical protein [Paratissierella segnis]MBC8589358.1 hypothetical protein [Paratissierella segnis]